MTAVDTTAAALAAWRHREDVRDLAGLVAEARTVDDLAFVRVETVAVVEVEKQRAGATRTPALKALEAALIHLARGGRDVSMDTGRKLAGDYLADALRALEVTP